MDHEELVYSILNHTPEVGPSILKRSGLGHPPDRERIYQELEEFLLPRVELLDHLLPKYQTYATFSVIYSRVD
jgi:hypothetical protein